MLTGFGAKFHVINLLKSNIFVMSTCFKLKCTLYKTQRNLKCSNCCNNLEGLTFTASAASLSSKSKVSVIICRKWTLYKYINRGTVWFSGWTDACVFMFITMLYSSNLSFVLIVLLLTVNVDWCLTWSEFGLSVCSTAKNVRLFRINSATASYSSSCHFRLL